MPARDSITTPPTSGDLISAGRWLLLSAVVGVVAGCGAIAFHFCTQVVSHYVLANTTGYVAPEPAGEHILFAAPTAVFSPWWILAVITAGGLASGLIVFTFAPEAEGHGTDAVIDAFHFKEGRMRARIPLVKLIASAITIGTGGSAGREGPIAQIGAGFGSLLGGWLKLSARDRRILLAAGMGAGIGSIFRAPLAGAIFAAEILYSEADIESEVIAPATISSIIAFLVFSYSLPQELRFVPLFGSALNFEFKSPLELIPLAILACVLVVVAIGYINCFYGTMKLFKKLPGPPHFRPAIGAALAGGLALAAFFISGQNQQILAVLSSGYGALQIAISDPAALGAGMLLTIAAIKILTTSLTIGTGGSGGVFGPSIVIGGCLSAGIGNFLHNWWPSLARQPEIYGIVGMAGFFAACAHAPISTIIMVAEITGDYQLLLPTMWVSMICFLLNRRWTLYIKQVPTRMDSPAHLNGITSDAGDTLPQN
jgi:chloride channel protein, CIC family